MLGYSQLYSFKNIHQTKFINLKKLILALICIVMSLSVLSQTDSFTKEDRKNLTDLLKDKKDLKKWKRGLSDSVKNLSIKFDRTKKELVREVHNVMDTTAAGIQLRVASVIDITESTMDTTVKSMNKDMVYVKKELNGKMNSNAATWTLIITGVVTGLVALMLFRRLKASKYVVAINENGNNTNTPERNGSVKSENKAELRSRFT